MSRERGYSEAEVEGDWNEIVGSAMSWHGSDSEGVAIGRWCVGMLAFWCLVFAWTCQQPVFAQQAADITMPPHYRLRMKATGTTTELLCVSDGFNDLGCKAPDSNFEAVFDVDEPLPKTLWGFARNAAGTSPPSPNKATPIRVGDCNRDGSINVMDIVCVSNLIYQGA